MIELSLMSLYVAAVLLIVCERIFPAHARNGSQLKWYSRALLINTVNLLVFVLLDWIVSCLGFRFSIWTLANTFTPLVGAIMAYIIFTFVVYWWHRLRHHSSFCW